MFIKNGLATKMIFYVVPYQLISPMTVQYNFLKDLESSPHDFRK